MVLSIRHMVTLFAALCAASPLPALACPFCKAPSLTLSDQVELAVSVKLLKLEGVQAKKNRPSAQPLADFRVIDEFIPSTRGRGGYTTTKSRSGWRPTQQRRAGPSKGSTLQFRLASGWRKGGLFLLLDKKPVPRDGIAPLPISQSIWSYLKAMPHLTAPAPERLRFFVRYLEHPETMIANDAYGEFANAPYEDIVSMRDALPRRRLRQWILDSRLDRSVIDTRLGLYGMLLGLCGEMPDAELLKRVIVDDWKPDDDLRLGIDGMIGGYLLLTGDAGLDVIVRTKLGNPDVSFSETYSAMQALRFMWTYGNGVIDRDRLRKAMRLLLDRSELTDLVIADLARWKDWEIQPRLMQMYDEETYPAVKRAIVRFILVSSRPPKSKPAKGRTAAASSGSESGKEVATNAAESEPAHVAQSRQYLAILRARDPKIVSDCERFFFLK